MAALLLLAFANSGCSAAFEIGRPAKPAIVAPAGSQVVETPAGEVVEEPASIDTVITGLRQAQETRTLVRQLAR